MRQLDPDSNLSFKFHVSIMLVQPTCVAQSIMFFVGKMKQYELNKLTLDILFIKKTLTNKRNKL